MTTLSAAPLSPLLDRLFADAEVTIAAVLPAIMQLPEDERAAMMASKTDYKDLYTRMKDAHLAVSRETGTLLYMLARSIGARVIVEFGASFGISTLHLAAALRDNGGGRLITSEFEPTKAAHARENFIAGGLSDLIEIREGDALETLARDLPDKIDLLLLDGAKGLYLDVLALVQDRLRRSICR
jgi:predicted O-methyltransferase YrrM